MSQQPITLDQLCPLHDDHRPQLRKILVVVDPTASTHPCVQKAARIAQACGAALELYMCDAERDLPLGWNQGEDHRAQRETRRAGLLSALERLAEPLRAAGLVVRTECEWSVPLEHGIGQHVIRTRPDLVVKDTHHHELTPTHGSVALTDWTLIRLLDVPLLLVKPDPWPARLRITVGVDPCRPAERPVALDESMLLLGEVLEKALRANLDIVHVLRPPPHLPGESISLDDKHREHTSARQAVERLVEDRTERGSSLLIQFVEGPVGPSIVEFARRHAPDLIILGAAARPRWAHAGASGTAAQVLGDLKSDLLVVKPPGFVSPLLDRGE
jgi:universal stress protein E